MKDKRQRIAVAWPYAAVYADPNFAASILQAAANSVGMPYYAPNGMVPPTQIPYTYGYRYSPYQIPQRNSTNSPSHLHSSPLLASSNRHSFMQQDLNNSLRANLHSLQNAPLSPSPGIKPKPEQVFIFFHSINNSKFLPWKHSFPFKTPVLINNILFFSWFQMRLKWSITKFVIGTIITSICRWCLNQINHTYLNHINRKCRNVSQLLYWNIDLKNVEKLPSCI